MNGALLLLRAMRRAWGQPGHRSHHPSVLPEGSGSQGAVFVLVAAAPVPTLPMATKHPHRPVTPCAAHTQNELSLSSN